MPFLLKADLLQAIRAERLDEITTDDALIDKVIRGAEETVASHLNSRFDVAAIYAEIGDDRNPVILKMAIDVALYDLHALINPRKIPELRADRHHYAMEWLGGVSAGRINPVGLPVPDTGNKDYVLFGSNTKRENHI